MSAERDALRKKIFAAMEAAEASEAKVVVEASEALVKAFVEPFAAINRAFAAPMRAAEKLFGPLKELEAFVEPLGVLVDALISECAKKTRKAKPRSSYRSAPARCGGRVATGPRQPRAPALIFSAPASALTSPTARTFPKPKTPPMTFDKLVQEAMTL